MSKPPFDASTLPQIKALSGAPATIIIAMILAQGFPVGRNDLVMATSFGKEKIQEGLEILETLGIARNFRRYRGWTLTPQAQQMILPGLGNPELLDQPLDDTLLPSGKSAQQTSPEEPEESIWHKARYKTLTQALMQQGIMRNARTEKLLTLPHLTPDYITGHALGLRAGGKGGSSHTGLLITALESGAPAPTLNANKHLADCECENCRALRYRESAEKYDCE